jgi:hypothetical protein
MIPVGHFCMLYIMYIAVLKDCISRNGNVGPGYCCRSVAVVWPSWSVTKRFNSLAVSHKRKYI